MTLKINVNKGDVFGCLIVLEEIPRRKHRTFVVKCECAKDFTTTISTLMSKTNLKMCKQCQRRAKGFYDKTKEYRCWYSMKSRCYNTKIQHFERYGGRGITVCDRWLYGDGSKGGFECFLEDMGECPEGSRWGLDRINNDGNYELSNCRWASCAVQSKNKNIYRSNNTGTVGVTFDNHNGERYRVQWVELDGTRKRKSFSVEKLGRGAALLLACEYRKAQILRLNNEGAGYGPQYL